MTKRTLASAAVGLALLGTAACSGSASYDSAAPAPLGPVPTTGATAERAIVEADIIQLDGGLLYALSASGSISVVDVSTPGRLALLGQTWLAGTPFEMYRRGNLLVTMWNGAFASDGSAIVPRTGSASTGSTYSAAPDPNAGSAVIVLDATFPAQLKVLATFPVPGELADSRIVGDILYLATYENAQCYRCGTQPRTLVTTFDVSNPMAMAQVDQASFASNAPDSYNLPWGSNWKRSIFVTQERLYIGGHADIEPTKLGTGAIKEGIIDVLDVTDPHGFLGRGSRIQVAGAILSRWQLDERNGVLRVVSQAGAGRTGNGIAMPQVETFTVASTQSFVPLGQTALQLPRQEGLRTVRFDQDRAYAITYNQTDPLFTIDLKDPAAPTVRGELHMPGFMFYLEPHGDRVIGLGIDRTDPLGSLNVSLFDVGDLDRPRMLQRVSFSTPGVSEDYQILNYELPEDQDRIQKAFRVFPDGIVAVPFTAAPAHTYGSVDSCASIQSGVQLIDWTSDTLSKRALLPLRGNPHRALEKDSQMITVSESNVRTFALASRGVATPTADLVIGTCVGASPVEPDYGFYEGDYHGYRRFGIFACSAVPTGTAAPMGAGTLAGGLLALAALARAVRRRTAG